MTPAAIRARLASLREAGAKLRRRPARETLDALARVVDGWSDPSGAWRHALETELPGATGFSAPMVRAGLARGLDAWSGDALRELVAREIGTPERLDSARARMAAGFDVTAVLLAGSIPMPTLVSLLAPLALRSPVLAKSASRDPVTPRLLARSLAETDAELAQCLEIVDIPGADAERTGALLEADCVVATGSDETISAVRARVQPDRRLVVRGHRVSVAALGAASNGDAALEDVAARLALDVALWDQLGCLSPIAVYVVGEDAADRVAAALARALAARDHRRRGRRRDRTRAGRRRAASCRGPARCPPRQRGQPLDGDSRGRQRAPSGAPASLRARVAGSRCRGAPRRPRAPGGPSRGHRH